MAAPFSCGVKMHKTDRQRESKDLPNRWAKREETPDNLKNKKKGCLKKIVVAILLLAVISGSFYVGRHSVLSGNGYGTGVNNGSVMRKLSVIEAYVGSLYFNKMDSEDIETGIYRGFISGLNDPYASYYTKEEYQQLLDSDAGSYEGIGISYVKNNDTGYAEIVSVFRGSPSYEAGIEAGDIITVVNGKDVTKMDTQEIATEIKNTKKNKVALTIERDRKKKEYKIKCSVVKIDSVSYKMKKGKIGYIAVSEFLENTGDQFNTAVDQLEKQGMKGLIIDLRDNGGGLLDTCIDMVSRIIPKGKLIVYTKDKKGNKTEYKSESKKTVDVPIVILVNGNTASASEIMTGCLKDYGKAEVVGMKTFGKGIVQNILKLPDGSAVKFTVSKYYTPKGHDIHEKGVKPDVTVKVSDEQMKKAWKSEKLDVQLKKAMEILQK